MIAKTRGKSNAAVLALCIPLFASAGCRQRSSIPPTSKPSTAAPGVITIIPFSADVQATAYGGPIPEVGKRLAHGIASGLRAVGWSATVAAESHAAAEGEIVVSGRMTTINGGSQAKRAIVGMGTGGAVFGARGEVVQAGGATISVGSERRSIGRIGYGGGTNEFVMGLCVDQVAADIAQQIVQGQYSRSPAPAPVARSTPSVEDRMDRLDELRRRNLITDDEYKSQLRRILRDL